MIHRLSPEEQSLKQKIEEYDRKIVLGGKDYEHEREQRNGKAKEIRQQIAALKQRESSYEIAQRIQICEEELKKLHDTPYRYMTNPESSYVLNEGVLQSHSDLVEMIQWINNRVYPLNVIERKFYEWRRN